MISGANAVLHNDVSLVYMWRRCTNVILYLTRTRDFLYTGIDESMQIVNYNAILSSERWIQVNRTLVVKVWLLCTTLDLNS